MPHWETWSAGGRRGYWASEPLFCMGFAGIISHWPGTNAWHLYRAVAPIRPAQMWGYYISTGHSHEPVQMWAHLYRLWLWAGTGVQRLFSILLPPARAPPLFFFVSPTRAPPPQWRPREFLPDLRRFFHDLTYWSSVEVSYFILPSYMVAILSNILCT
jgi:hypothetical protein